ncbi:hypothetical protein [Halanaerobium salsuginis]|uniref:Uncharacterized protein n=1 Tax=Halanaerobium salsuginis TaxID=29563 RepID=A0A1I4GMK2_9FIRM|nr:hypothetical protein [Halanaerobium salsuginis]SFL31282.1 hypothetical protein SAMN02983006_00812 [Halanaerobium salsuginis]
MKLLSKRIVVLLSCLLFCVFSLTVFAEGERDLLGKLELGQVLKFAELEGYQEAPELEKLVKAGKLPPIAERIPTKPLIRQAATMLDGPRSVWWGLA